MAYKQSTMACTVGTDACNEVANCGNSWYVNYKNGRNNWHWRRQWTRYTISTKTIVKLSPKHCLQPQMAGHTKQNKYNHGEYSCYSLHVPCPPGPNAPLARKPTGCAWRTEPTCPDQRGGTHLPRPRLCSTSCAWCTEQLCHQHAHVNARPLSLPGHLIPTRSRRSRPCPSGCWQRCRRYPPWVSCRLSCRCPSCFSSGLSHGSGRSWGRSLGSS